MKPEKLQPPCLKVGNVAPLYECHKTASLSFIHLFNYLFITSAVPVQNLFLRVFFLQSQSVKARACARE